MWLVIGRLVVVILVFIGVRKFLRYGFWDLVVCVVVMLIFYNIVILLILEWYVFGENMVRMIL